MLTQKCGVYYKIGTSMVKVLYALVSMHVSSPFALGRGVRQGFILSSALFLLVMDPLLRQLQSLSIGASVNNMYAGGFLHADDIRTFVSSATTVKAQISTITKFTEDNFLKLNTSKCEIVAFKKSSIYQEKTRKHRSWRM